MDAQKILVDLFSKHEDFIVNSDKKQLDIRLCSNYGSIDLECDFENNKFTVIGSMDESQYSALFMVDEDEIEEDELDEWNTTDKYNNIIKALERCQEILDAYYSESDGSQVLEDDDASTIFDDAIKLIKGK